MEEKINPNSKKIHKQRKWTRKTKAPIKSKLKGQKKSITRKQTEEELFDDQQEELSHSMELLNINERSRSEKVSIIDEEIKWEDEHSEKEFGKKWCSRISEIFDLLQDLKAFVTRYPEFQLDNTDFENEYCKVDNWTFEHLKSLTSNFPEEMSQITQLVDQKMQKVNTTAKISFTLRKYNVQSFQNKDTLMAWLCTDMSVFAGKFYNVLLAVISNLPEELFYELYTMYEKQGQDLKTTLAGLKYMTSELHENMINELFQKEIESLATKSDTESSLRISFLHFALKDILKSAGRSAIHYSFALEKKEIKFIKIDDSTIEGRILLKTKTLFFNLLTLDHDGIKKALRFYQLLDIAEEKEWENLPFNYLKQEIANENKEDVIKHLQELFPESFLISYLWSAWAVTMIDTNFVLNKDLFTRRLAENNEKYINTRAATILFVIIHELAHKKKIMHMAN